MTALETILAIERRMWANDPDFYERTLLPDAVLVFAETGAIARDTAVAAIRRENAENRRWADVQWSDLVSRSLTPEVVLISYRVVARWSNETSNVVALASSVYVRRDDEWRLALHQQTPVNEENP